MSATRQALFWLGALALFFYLLHVLSGMLLPFVAGFGIAYLLSPLVAMATRWHVPRGASALAVLLLFLAVLVAVIVLIVPVIQLQAAQLAQSAPAITAYLRAEGQHLLDFAQQQLPPEDMQKARDMVGDWAGSSRTESVAGVGNVFTRPDCRGQGLAQTVTSAVVMALKEAGIRTLGLNVEQTNPAAIRAYERIGFRAHFTYYEGLAERVSG